ncbi:MAG: outer membrane beta-barrel protein [Prevotella sp.]|nr:outer membrane beta-barrel protein [Prevotella sp.]
MFARGASTEIDAAYSNPAGLAWGQEGWQLSLNFQKPWQNRDIEASVPGYLGSNFDKKYNGVASAPIVPALFASYKKDRLAISGMIGIVGSGGFVEYDEGIPMFEVPLRALLAQAGLMPSAYNYSANMKGKQYIYGAQINVAYKIDDNWAVAIGLRGNYYDGYNRGFVNATMDQTTNPLLSGPVPLIDLQLDCIQRGFGVAPIVSVDYHNGPLTIAARYEFRTKISTKNDTKELTIYQVGQDNPTNVPLLIEKLGREQALGGLTQAMGEDMVGKMTAFLPDEEVRYDMPSLLVAAIGYEFTPQLRAALEYHFFDDTHAKMYGGRQKTLEHGTHEILAGVEYDINKKFTVSCGGQHTDYGLSDAYQQNTSFACDSYSVGLGGAWNINEKMRLNVSYFCSLYSDYEKGPQSNYQGTPYTGTETYSRTNHVIGVGLDYKF